VTAVASGSRDSAIEEQHQCGKAGQPAPEMRLDVGGGERRQQPAMADGDHAPDRDKPERRTVEHQFGREKVADACFTSTLISANSAAATSIQLDFI
jgi:hypothetical protein